MSAPCLPLHALPRAQRGRCRALNSQVFCLGLSVAALLSSLAPKAGSVGVIQHANMFDCALLPQVRKLGPNANPAVLKTLPIASGAMWTFYFG